MIELIVVFTPESGKKRAPTRGVQHYYRVSMCAERLQAAHERRLSDSTQLRVR